MSKLHYIENFGTGIPRILEAYEKSTKKVDYSVSDNFFIIKLPNLNYCDPVNDPVNDPEKIIVNNALNDVDLSILRMIQLNPGLNAKQISEKLHLQYSRITLDVLKNSLKRKLFQYVEFRGSSKKRRIFCDMSAVKKIVVLSLISFVLMLSGCSSKNVKSNLTPDDIVKLYSTSQYKTLVEDYTDSESIKYNYSVKAFNKENESRDYLFIYFFSDDKTANDFYKENNSKTGIIWIFGLIFGENLNVKYEKYDYMVLEYDSKTSKDLISIYKDFIYE